MTDQSHSFYGLAALSELAAAEPQVSPAKVGAVRRLKAVPVDEPTAAEISHALAEMEARDAQRG